jgi:plastocyanin
MKIVLVTVVVVCGLGVAASWAAEAPTRTVAMPGKVFEPAKLDVLVGTTVTWKNDDATNHTVTTDDDTIASGYIPPGGSFSFSFARQGRYAYHCTIHKFMRGEVNVFGLVLAGPEAPVRVGRRVILAGLAPPGTSDVTVQGPGVAIVVRARPDGSFAARLLVRAPGRYRALAGQLSSPSVRVTARPVVTLARSGTTLRVSASPARPGASALLQAYDRERFDWVAVSRATLDAASRARLTVSGEPERVRVLIKGSHGWADAASPVILLRGGGTTGGARTDAHPHMQSG